MWLTFFYDMPVNAIDFGDLTIGRAHPDACSNGHGGLG